MCISLMKMDLFSEFKKWLWGKKAVPKKPYWYKRKNRLNNILKPVVPSFFKVSGFAVVNSGASKEWRSHAPLFEAWKKRKEDEKRIFG